MPQPQFTRFPTENVAPPAFVRRTLLAAAILAWLGVVVPTEPCGAVPPAIRDNLAPQSPRPADVAPAQARQLSLPDRPYAYSRLEIPDHFRPHAAHLDNTPPENPITDDGATLGRVLFYDTTLSVNGTTACASCHRQENAFSEPRDKSIGFDGQQVDRNSMSLVNLRYYQRGKFFWDERAATLEQQVLMPIENPIEMGHNLSKLVNQLQQDPIYPPLFAKAFGDDRVSRDRIAKALAQFVRSIVSFRSRFDVGLAQVDSPQTPFPNFTDEENLGKKQFFGRGRCAECHLPTYRGLDREASTEQWSIFQLERPGNNGVDSEGGDPGLGRSTGRRQDLGKFKPSTLRNIAVTGPYMHDGRFHTLDQVIEHYNWSVRPHENLDERLRDFAANGLALPEVPKVALAKFLRTLTDEQLLTDPMYADPFEPAAH
ncbi:cytochrome-c peroxidase [Roseiconus nitratireducens]|uniref:Cytochrome-c peroxidase n=1 Tax=Roseiconus nitratireducens TaxID=2605748 RepID=A0A5M6CXW5_9BACT|nr:cytochrome c peroxidase [Roseiconus nitratireducens]KAA5540041.1 cytochrome-c peroxidase [Roseiconus nitratireducens]